MSLNKSKYWSQMYISSELSDLEGFIISVDGSLQALASHNKEAFEWWIEWTKQYPRIPSFVFDSGCYEVVE